MNIEFRDMEIFSANHKPKEGTNCILLYGKYQNENTSVMFGSYDAKENVFRDGLGSVLDANLVRYWSYDYNCFVKD